MNRTTLTPHRKRLLDLLHEYTLRTMESLEKRIMAGKCDSLQTEYGIHRAFHHQAIDDYRHKKMMQKHCEVVPLSELPQERAGAIWESWYSNGEAKPEESER